MEAQKAEIETPKDENAPEEDKAPEEEELENEEELQQWFAACDVDKNGTISGNALVMIIRCDGQNPDCNEVKQILENVNTYNDGKLTYEEVKKILLKRKKITLEEEKEKLREAFKVIDKNGDGKLQAEDIIRFLTEYGEDKLTREEAQDIIDDVYVHPANIIFLEDLVELLSMAMSDLRWKIKRRRGSRHSSAGSGRSGRGRRRSRSHSRGRGRSHSRGRKHSRGQGRGHSREREEN